MHILNFVDVHAYAGILMTVAYKLLALLIPLLCALVNNLDLYFMTSCGNLLKCLQNQHCSFQYFLYSKVTSIRRGNLKSDSKTVRFYIPRQPDISDLMKSGTLGPRW